MFGTDARGFGETAWDVLLLLYTRGDRGLQIRDLVRGIGRDTRSVGADVEWLSSRGLVEIARTFAILTERGRGLMDDYLEVVEGYTGGFPLPDYLE